MTGRPDAAKPLWLAMPPRKPSGPTPNALRTGSLRLQSDGVVSRAGKQHPTPNMLGPRYRTLSHPARLLRRELAKYHESGRYCLTRKDNAPRKLSTLR